MLGGLGAAAAMACSSGGVDSHEEATEVEPTPLQARDESPVLPTRPALEVVLLRCQSPQRAVTAGGPAELWLEKDGAGSCAGDRLGGMICAKRVVTRAVSQDLPE